MTPVLRLRAATSGGSPCARLAGVAMHCYGQHTPSVLNLTGDLLVRYPLIGPTGARSRCCCLAAAEGASAVQRRRDREHRYPRTDRQRADLVVRDCECDCGQQWLQTVASAVISALAPALNFGGSKLLDNSRSNRASPSKPEWFFPDPLDHHLRLPRPLWYPRCPHHVGAGVVQGLAENRHWDGGLHRASLAAVAQSPQSRPPPASEGKRRQRGQCLIRG